MLRFARLVLRSERPTAEVPVPVIAALLIALIAQIAWHGLRPPPAAAAEDLPEPPAYEVLNAIAFGEPASLSRFLMLWLQAFDNQPGISVPFRRLDYERVRSWLGVILRLDPRSAYPLLCAARIYSKVADEERKRIMLDFVREEFLKDADVRWPWMAHAVFVAKHELRDLDLALALARELRLHATAVTVPTWARQMELFVLEELGDIEGAKVLLGGLIESGAVKDPHELRFLMGRLDIRGSE
ncbi:MAG: hypothetical protein HYY48_10885 [Gammaproteobacteria bacterium]|nr:hypothetical protein [Gammaproteobacteria bacterium]